LSTYNKIEHRFFSPALQVTAVLLTIIVCGGVSACGKKDQKTSVLLNLHFDANSVSIDQFQILGFESSDATPFAQEMIPADTVGVFDSGQESVAIVLPDSQAGREIIFRVHGLFDGTIVASGQTVVTPQKRKQVTVTVELTPPAVSCGNGVVEDFAGEECDDGNNNNMDDCTTSCTMRTGGVGDPCQNTSDCNDGADWTCLNEWNGGYCTVAPCNLEAPQNSCPLGSVCTLVDGQTICVEICTMESACRWNENQACRLLGDGLHGCLPETVAVCGDGIAEQDESCDATDLDDATCTTLGHDGGTLFCGPDCTYDETACTDCGNGIIEGSEECDGTNLGTITCGELPGQDGGMLGCTDNCTFDVSGCYVCGDTICALENSENLDNCPQDCGRWIDIVTGDLHTCALRSDHTVWCWGENSSGQLGDGTTDPAEIPLQVTDLSTTALGVTTGYDHTCAWLTTGALRCWGANGTGQTGIGSDTDPVLVPTEVTDLSTVVFASGGKEHTCAVTTDATAACWGKNDKGQVGNGTFEGPHLSPTSVMGCSTDLVDTSAGKEFSCALDIDGAVWCWGRDNSGQLANGATSTDDMNSASLAEGLLDTAEMVDLGDEHGCAVLSSGTIMCWGKNDQGRLGDNTNIQRDLPVAVLDLINGAQVSAGKEHTCAIDTNGIGWCWGKGGGGRLGNDGETDSWTPTAVNNLTDILRISAGGLHTCAVDQNGEAWCWGDDGSGQLGDGVNVDPQIIPVQVVKPWQ
jgi:cysteine-rich repeat protein